MTLDQLRILVAVAETGSFSAAARKLGRVQSAISQSVQSLETTLGIPLFDRDGKVPKLNDAGRALLGDAQQLIRGAETLPGAGGEHRDRCRAGAEARRRSGLPDRGADGEPQGVHRGLSVFCP